MLFLKYIVLFTDSLPYFSFSPFLIRFSKVLENVENELKSIFSFFIFGYINHIRLLYSQSKSLKMENFSGPLSQSMVGHVGGTKISTTQT